MSTKSFASTFASIFSRDKISSVFSTRARSQRSKTPVQPSVEEPLSIVPADVRDQSRIFFLSLTAYQVFRSNGISRLRRASLEVRCTRFPPVLTLTLLTG